jgi:hypothetical protein
LIAALAACGPSAKIIRRVDLSGYNGIWYSDDYGRFVTEEGDTAMTGSLLVMDPAGNSIKLQCFGPPPMSRIAEVITAFSFTGPYLARFHFDDDNWANRGSGWIEFKDCEIVIEIKIEKRAETDMQIFEGRVSFMQTDADSGQ